MEDTLKHFKGFMAEDERVYLVKEVVNTLLSSSQATEKNKLFKLTEGNHQDLRDSIRKSERFDEEEKEALLNLVEVASENNYNFRQVSVTWDPKATAMDAIKTYKAMIEDDPAKRHDELMAGRPSNLDF